MGKGVRYHDRAEKDEKSLRGSVFSQKSQKGTNNEDSERKTDLAKSRVREVCDLRLLNIAQLFLAIIIQNPSDNVVAVSQRAIMPLPKRLRK